MRSWPSNFSFIANKHSLYFQYLKLQKVISYGSLVLFDKNGKLRKFRNVEQILSDFFDARLQMYERRKKHQVSISFNILRAHFLLVFWHQKFPNPKHSFVIFWANILYEKCAHKTLMKIIRNHSLRPNTKSSITWQGMSKTLTASNRDFV